MRIAILREKRQRLKISVVSDDVAFLIAKNLRSNVRELEGALNRVVAYARFHGREIGLDVAKEALRDIIGATNRQISMELVQKTVSDYYKIKVADMFSQKRTRAIAPTRDRSPCGLPENSPLTAFLKSVTPLVAVTTQLCCTLVAPLSTLEPRTDA
jgi:chromosomal replication initiator protein